jgi:hypothetical protein
MRKACQLLEDVVEMRVGQVRDIHSTAAAIQNYRVYSPAAIGLTHLSAPRLATPAIASS